MSSPLYSQEAEDDGYGDWLHDREKDRLIEEEDERCRCLNVSAKTVAPPRIG